VGGQLKMSDTKPTWLPKNCVHYGINQLKPERRSKEQPNTLFGVVQRGPAGYLHTVGSGDIIGPIAGEPSYHWSIDFTRKDRQLFEALQKAGVERFFRMYQGLDFAVMSALKRARIFNTKKGDTYETYFSRADDFLVRSDVLENNKK
jgi:hypothetical protein